MPPDISVSAILAEQAQKVPRDPTGAVARGMGAARLVDAREEGLKLGPDDRYERISVPVPFSVTMYENATPQKNADGVNQLSGAKYQTNFVVGDYNVPMAYINFGLDGRHFAFACYKVKFLCKTCWRPEPDHDAICPRNEAAAKAPRSGRVRRRR